MNAQNKTQKTLMTALAAAVLGTSALAVQAQQGFVIPGPGGAAIPTTGGNMLSGSNAGFFPMAGNSAFGNLGSGYFFGFNPAIGSGLMGAGYSPYGGYYGYNDPTIAVTPFGIQPLGYGYNGFTGTGEGYNNSAGMGAFNPNWAILNNAYSQGYQDALNMENSDTTQNNANTDTAPQGMTATPRNSVSRVPHGSDSVRMWRVGRGEIALRWQGDGRIASSVTFALTDRDGKVLRRTTVDQLPAEVRFTPTKNAMFYQVNVRYVDGATNTIMGRL